MARHTFVSSPETSWGRRKRPGRSYGAPRCSEGGHRIDSRNFSLWANISTNRALIDGAWGSGRRCRDTRRACWWPDRLLFLVEVTWEARRGAGSARGRPWDEMGRALFLRPLWPGVSL